MKTRNETASLIGYVFGQLSLCGFCHFYTGRVGSSFMWLLVKGPLRLIPTILIGFTGIGLLWAAPFWLKKVREQALDGATEYIEM